MRNIVSDALIVGVVGAGVMGTGIAQVAAVNGISVLLYDHVPGVAQKARDEIFERLFRLVETGRMSVDHVDAAENRITVVNRLEELARCNVVIEAITEQLDVKVALFRKLETIVTPEAVLATNTSSFSIGAIAAQIEHKKRFAGMHFFNPVPAMRLVEVTPGPDTDPLVIDKVTVLAGRFGREPITVSDTPGLLVNFGGRAYATEALAILQEQVATPAQIDAVMRDAFGFRMGPFELMDLTGMDVNFPVTESVHQSMFGDPRLRSTPFHKYKHETGQLGRKSGRGFFRYDEMTDTTSADSQSDAAPAKAVFVADGATRLIGLLKESGVEILDRDDGLAPILVAPLGEDCSAVAARRGLDHRRLIACDMLGDTSKRITIMTAPGADAAHREAVVALFAQSRAVTAIADSTGFIAQRIIAMVINLGCEMAQMGLATPTAIDKALKLAMNYPEGPLYMADQLGLQTVFEIMTTLQALTGDDRYRPSQWLRRRAQIGVSARAV